MFTMVNGLTLTTSQAFRSISLKLQDFIITRQMLILAGESWLILIFKLHSFMLSLYYILK